MDSAFPKYEKLEEIGYAFKAGTVFANGYMYRGLNAESQPVILREVSLLGEKKGIPSGLLREISFLMAREHENILWLKDVLLTADEEGICLLFEYMKQNLEEILYGPEASPQPILAKKYLQHILQAISYYHSRKALHGNLTPANLWVDTEKQVLKVSDLGLKKALDGNFETDEKHPISFRYMAPELLTMFEKGFANDIWSAGCIFAEMLKKKPLFPVTSEMAVASLIFRYLGNPTEETLPGIFQMFPILASWPKYPALNLESHFYPLDQQGVDLLRRMLVVSPKDRITAEEALKHPYFSDGES